MSNVKVAKKTIAGAALLVTAPVWAKSGQGSATGSKDQPGVNHLILEEMPGRNVTLCANSSDAATKTGAALIPDNLTVAVNPFETSFIEIMFEVSDIVADEIDKVLYLVYSPRLSPSPQIPTPRSIKKLELDMSALEILARYEVPALNLLPQFSTRIGAANPAPVSKMVFKVNLDTATLPIFMRNSESIFLQAALINADDEARQDFGNMILSEVDTISFVEECPPDYSYCAVDDDGTLTTKIVGGGTKVAETSSASESSTTKTKD